MNYMKQERNRIPVTVQLLLIKEKKVLLMKRANTGYEDGKYCLPGGYVEKKEELKEAMIREAKEEIGISLKKQDLQLYKVLNRKLKNGEYIDFVFKSNKWEGEIINKEEEKCAEVIWCDWNNLPCNVLPFILEVLKNDNEVYLPYGWDEE